MTQTDAARTPTFWTNVINGLPVVRFDGLDDSLDVGAIRDVSGGLHAIVVSQRLPPQVSGPRWQRIMSTWDGVGANDWSGSSWSIAASRDKAGDPVVFGPEIQVKKKAGGVEIDNVQLARNTQNGVQFFSGDIAEVIIFDRELAASEEGAIKGYLNQKWGYYLDPKDAIDEHHAPPVTSGAILVTRGYRHVCEHNRS